MHRNELEQAVICLAFQSPHHFKMECLPFLSTEDFIDPLHRKAFTLSKIAIESGRLPDGLTIKNCETIDKNAPGYLIKLVNSDLYLPANAAEYTQELRDLSRNELVKREAERLAASVMRVGAVAALAKFRLATEHASGTSYQAIKLADAARDTCKHYREHLKRVAEGEKSELRYSTGFPTIDEATGGFYPGQVWLLSARSFAGKTYWAMDFAYNLASEGTPACFHCMEMQSWELAERELARRTNFSMKTFTDVDLKETDIDFLERFIDKKFESLPLYLAPPSELTPREVASRIKYDVSHHGCKVAFVDHLQRLSYSNRHDELRHELKSAMKLFKNLAVELKITIFVLSQLNVSNEKAPTLADLSEGKQITEEADVTCLLHKVDKTHVDLIFKKVRKRDEVILPFKYEGGRFRDAETVQAQHSSEYAGDFP